MLKSFITLKPSASPISLKNIFSKKNKKLINFFVHAMEQLNTILNFLSLDDILNIYHIFKNCKNGKEVQSKIIFYLMISQRNYTSKEEKAFLQQITKNGLRINLSYYNFQNSIWKESIESDVERTYVQNMICSKNQLSSNQTQVNTQYKKMHQISLKPLSGLKCSFLLFHYGEPSPRGQEEKAREERAKLKNYLKIVLNAVSNRNQNIGYVQGLNYWIKNMYETKYSEAEAFQYACLMLEKMNAEMLFRDGMIKVQQLCYVFEIYLFNNLPNIYYLLKKQDISSTMYASNWFITLFSQQLSKRIINKLWHLFMLKGWKIFIKFSIAIMCAFQDSIKKTAKDQLHMFMRNILQNINTEKQKKIWIIMNSIKVSNKMIDYLSKQMKILSKDTEIQLWRLQLERVEAEKLRKFGQKRFSLSCKPNVCVNTCEYNTDRYERLSTRANYSEEKMQGFCCSNYSQSNIKTERSEQKTQFLSFCKSVTYV